MLGSVMKWRAFTVVALLGLAAATACGGDPEQASPAPDGAAPDLVLIEVTRDHLPSMVLTHSEAQLEFPSLQSTPDGAGFQDDEQAAGQTIDPDDTIEDLVALGRLDGYSAQFVDLEVLSTGVTSQDSPLNLTAIVNLFDTAGSAGGFLKDRVDEIQRFAGVDLGGNVIEDFEHAGLPNMGDDAVAGRLTIATAAFGSTANGWFVLWKRGPVVANLAAVVFDDSDLSEALERLARQMDRRIMRVLAGEILPPPLDPAAAPPVTQAADVAGGQAAAEREGFDLAAMLPAVGILPEGLVLVADGYLTEAGAVASYQREFVRQEGSPASAPMPVIDLKMRVDLYNNALEPVTLMAALSSLSADALRNLVEQGLGAGITLTPEDVVVSTLVGLPPIGDVSGGFHISVVASAVEREDYFIFASRGRVSYQLFIQGVTGQLTQEEVVRIALLIDERVLANSP